MIPPNEARRLAAKFCRPQPQPQPVLHDDLLTQSRSLAATAMRLLRNYRRAARLCIRCGIVSISEPNRTTCQACGERYRLSKQAQRQRHARA